MVRLTDCFDMTIAVDWGVKPQTEQIIHKHNHRLLESENKAFWCFHSFGGSKSLCFVPLFFLMITLFQRLWRMFPILKFLGKTLLIYGYVHTYL